MAGTQAIRRTCYCGGRALVLSLLAGSAQLALAQGSGYFDLGSVTVIGKRTQIDAVGDEQVASVVERETMRLFNRDDVGDALNLLSGVTLAANSRNEKTIAVRGFDAREVPLFIDGIPVYVPYDGYVDFNRFTTWDLAAIQVAKGFSSVVYGPNTLGGAINLVSRKPHAAYEGDVTMGAAAGNAWQVAANAGTNQGTWYAQAGLSAIESDGFELSLDFTPTPTENGGRRNNDYRKDSKLSLKIGITPNAEDEYAISYYQQNGEKGQPPSTDPAYARYWRWPYWDKESVYFVAKTALTDTESLRLTAYHDRFDNEVNSYTDDSYTELRTSGRGSVGTGRSIYHDRINGGSIVLESNRLTAHSLRLVGHYKEEEHRELDAIGSENTHYKDAIVSFGAEDTIQLAPSWSLSVGLAYHELRPKTVFNAGNAYTLSDKQNAVDAQAGLFFDWTEATRFYATLASKTRLPTLKDRYSQRLGTFIENPELQAEESVNIEVGVQSRTAPGVRADAALFYSDITDKIQRVADVRGTLSQMQNVGKVRVSGLELGLHRRLYDWLELGGDYTYIDLDNRSRPEVKLTDIPRHKLTAQALLQPLEAVEVVIFAEHNSSRWASNTTELSGFTRLNLKVAYQAFERTTLELGVDNLTDRDYALTDGFPSPGRMWFANASYRF
ncbi:MAG: TonB-dependent receptor [Halioglobus sp.]|nr:TonB-dependent receptor [Halioglobus sp.]